ncbi:MAG: histidine kinase dimerization/phospho-acceptor domain-containing protein [Pseudomonadota bacterium]
MTSNLTEPLWDHHPDALIAISPDGLLMRCNPAAEAMFGRTDMELQGQPVQMLLASLCDQNAHQRLEQALHDKDAELKNAALAQEQLFIRLSHDLCNPLNSVIGFTGTLLMKLPGPLNPEQENQLRIIQTSARRMLTQINTLLGPAEREETTPYPKRAEE